MKVFPGEFVARRVKVAFYMILLGGKESQGSSCSDAGEERKEELVMGVERKCNDRPGRG